MSIKPPVAILAAATLGLAACQDPDGTRNNVGTGALAGAAAGATLGAILGDNNDKVIIGAVAGAALGAGIGNELEKQEQALRRDIGGSGAQIINTGDRLIVSLPEAITFAVDSATVSPSIRDDILAIARNLQEYPNNTVQVIGHTDNTGSQAYNQDLSERRAASVAQILLQGGVPNGRIVAFGVGENQPVASNSTAAGRQQNRRVEIVISPNA